VNSQTGPNAVERSDSVRRPPATRYQGSKLKLLDWIWENVADLDFETVLDAFGGTGSVSYLFKDRGKAVTYNDALRFNHWVGTALIENSGVPLTARAIDTLQRRKPGRVYDDFIARTYRNIFFTGDENAWLDVVCQNIPQLKSRYERAVAYYALFQACLSKRPYNLFHRKNLYMRTANVRRQFGNKATWDKPFGEHFRHFAGEANRALFAPARPCRAICADALAITGDYDLVYIDPPYVNRRGVGVDYLDFYHFLEGLVDYENWASRIDRRRKHRPLRREASPWTDPKQIGEAFSRLFRRFASSIVVVSYRSDGIPSAEELMSRLREVKRDVRCLRFGSYRYVLSTNRSSDELLLIGQ
jgi:adenine-specific DNA methylase